MNAEKLSSIIQSLVSKEAALDVQSSLDRVANTIRQLSSAPQNTEFQTQLATMLAQLRGQFSQLAQSFTPGEVENLREIGAAEFFVDHIPDLVGQLISENQVTLAVAAEKIEELRNRRSEYLNNLREMNNRLGWLGIRPEAVRPGSTELDILIPRTLFQNRFDNLVKELGTLNRILRAFSEVATGSAEEIAVGQISTTDPLISLLLDPRTAATIALAVKWALDTWKEVEEIRKARAETAKLKAFSEDDIETIFDKKIEAILDQRVGEKVANLLGDKAKGAGRGNEQRTDLKWALESILSRIERGLTIDVRYLEPPKESEGLEGENPNAESFKSLSEVVQQLSFPPPESNPVLELPPSEPPAKKPEKKE